MTSNISGQINSTGNRRINQPQTKIEMITKALIETITKALRLSGLNIADDETSPKKGRIVSFDPICAPNDLGNLNHINTLDSLHFSQSSTDRLANNTSFEERDIVVGQQNRKFLLNILINNYHQMLSDGDLTALDNALNQDDELALTQVAKLVFDGLPTSGQAFDSSKVKCPLTKSALDELDNPVFIQPSGVFELKALLKWWLAKGTDPVTRENLSLAQLEKVSVLA